MFWKPAQLMVNLPKSSLLVKVHFTLHSATQKSPNWQHRSLKSGVIDKWSQKYDECARSLTVLLKSPNMVYVCVCVCVALSRHLGKLFSESHMLFFFLRGGQQFKTCTEGQLKTSTCTPEPTYRGIPGREDKQPFFKSQPFWFLWITFSLKPYHWCALGTTLNVSLGALGRTRRKK